NFVYPYICGTTYLANHNWLKQYQPATKEVIANLEQGTIPVLASQIDRCSVVSHSHLVVL
ncbi:MAG: hypothetical protein BRC51_01260, partial [Cyanobacteria bacterium SW_12_48_29]